MYKGIYSTRPVCPNCGIGALVNQIYGDLSPPNGVGVTVCDNCGANIELYFETSHIQRARLMDNEPRTSR